MADVTFTKLFSSITESTVWCENDQVRIVWITMLAMANKNGFVFGSVPGLANRARVPVEAAREAIVKFQQPDADSRTKEYEGRRIEEVDGGWRLLNYSKHRAIRDEEERRDYMKNLMRDKRAKNVSNVSRREPPLSQAEADSREQIAERSKATTLAPQVEEIYQLYPKKVGKREAVKAISAAIKRVEAGEYKGGKLTETQAIAGIKNRTVMFAQSAAGRRGKMTPHPATWFNRSSYLDDPKEWNCDDEGPSKTQARVNHNREAILAGLGISDPSGPSEPDLQDRDDGRRESDLEGNTQGTAAKLGR